MNRRTIAVLSAGRSDFGRYRPVLRALAKRKGVIVRLFPGGSHFSDIFGNSISEIIAAGFDWEPCLEDVAANGAPESVGGTIGRGAELLAKAFAAARPDLLVVLGDRFEMLSGAAAALGFNIPIAHIHGGAVTEGAIDELVRHALTKMSHLHLVSCEQSARRVRQMGEEAWRVTVTGAPGLDELKELASLGLAKTSERIGLDLRSPTLVICYHPVTLEVDRTGEQMENMLAAVAATGLQAVLTYPNADHGNSVIIESLEAFAAANPDNVRLLKNAGTNLFASLLSHAAVLVGNSSSAIVEAPAFELSAVNIGTRQDGKVKAENVIDVGYGRDEIGKGIEKARSLNFRESLKGLKNPYGDGRAGERIADILAAIPLDDRLLRKKFIDL